MKGEGEKSPSPVPQNNKAPVDETKTLIGLVDNIGAISILALLIFRLPQLLSVMNEGKKEIANIMKEGQKEAYDNYSISLKSQQDATDKRYETLEELIVAQTKALEALINRVEHLERK